MGARGCAARALGPLGACVPLHLTKAALDLDDDRHPYSWLAPDDAQGEASELAERGPEAFPD